VKNPIELFRFFFLQRVKGFEIPAAPHLDEIAGPFFADLLGACTAYLEFGTGGSTLLADKLEKKTLSVESDRFFARAVRQSLRTHSKVEIVDIDIGLTGPWSYPIFNRPTQRRLRRWSNYSSRPFDVLKSQGWFPDFVFVDGRFRRACVLQTARSALAEGREAKLLLDDYFLEDREHYHAVEQWLGTPRRAGRAALFTIDEQHTRVPSKRDIAEAASDYR
jgi:hypothetical protein